MLARSAGCKPAELELLYSSRKMRVSKKFIDVKVLKVLWKAA